MPRVRSEQQEHDPSDERSPRRLPLRWAIIIGLAAAVAIVTATVAGLPGGLAAFVITAGALDAMLA